ncbi:hypothetical protein J4460_06470 [Candidatus Woesearchaeota archaeon]|nr:MAG: hypothetical protein QS99_C0016G0076 [archaeon GW2011_AR4]MBS3130287.1 hypothetical protein [Candidatus Woesearchaeota archaeon]HIH37334.1 hypothetical protein [Candidatus Woesearchaeota archaeon]HIH48757.1 hypothetical protein [Candidatus Woesearchaeota archaeon]HIJ04151.1 hypothetical protein [Candidatus Woesearchaeota archaeon]
MDIALNGFGRVNQYLLYLVQRECQVNVAAIADTRALTQIIDEYNASFGSTPSRAKKEYCKRGEFIIVAGQKIPFFHTDSPVPWPFSSIDCLIEGASVVEREGLLRHGHNARFVVMTGDVKGDDGSIQTYVDRIGDKGPYYGSPFVCFSSDRTQVASPILQIAKDIFGRAVPCHITTLRGKYSPQSKDGSEGFRGLKRALPEYDAHVSGTILFQAVESPAEMHLSFDFAGTGLGYDRSMQEAIARRAQRFFSAISQTSFTNVAATERNDDPSALAIQVNYRPIELYDHLLHRFLVERIGPRITPSPQDVKFLGESD